MRQVKIFFILILLVFVMSACASRHLVTSRTGEEVEVECQPTYGNWCGKGYPAHEITGYIPDPVDIWDETCMEHDRCYEQNGESGEDMCDRDFFEKLELLNMMGIPAPHQMINAYNVFKDNKPYRQLNISFKDIWNVNTISCDGREGLPVLFCDVGMGINNCEITMGIEQRGARCFCNYPPRSLGPFFPGAYLEGRQKTANDFN